MSSNLKSILYKKTFIFGIIALILLPITLLAIGCYLVMSGINTKKTKKIFLGTILISLILFYFIYKI